MNSNARFRDGHWPEYILEQVSDAVAYLHCTKIPMICNLRFNRNKNFKNIKNTLIHCMLLAVIDWLEFGVAVRQLDLGSVLLFLDESCGDAFIEKYLKKTGIHADKKTLKKNKLSGRGAYTL